MVKQLARRTRTKTRKAIRPKLLPEKSAQEEEILRAATLHLITKHGMFLVASGLREASVKGIAVWIIAVTLRYTTGHEGYVGDLLFDGDDFMFLTEKAVMNERIAAIANHPDRLKKWHEFHW